MHLLQTLERKVVKIKTGCTRLDAACIISF